MEYWKIATPSLLLFGKGKSESLPEVLTDLGYKKPFLVIDTEVKRSAKGSSMIGQLDKFGIETFDKFSTNPTTKHVHSLVEKLNQFNPDVIIGIGGGSTIDLSKASNLVHKNGGSIEEYLGGKKTENHLLPMIFLPTTAGTGSEASPFAVIKDDSVSSKRGIESLEFLPKLVILDPEFLETLDTVLVAATGVDALTHIIESYISRKANDLTRSSARGLLNDIIPNIEKAVFDKNSDAYLKMMNAAFASRLLYPRTGLTIAHALSHPLGAFTDIHHGLAVTFFLKDSIIFNRPDCENALTDVSKLMGFTNTDIFLGWLDKFFIKSGIASEIHSYLLTKTPPIKQMAIDAMKSSNIPTNPREVTADDLEIVIEKSFKYWGLK